MRRQSQYADSSIDPLVAEKMHHIAVQRMHNSDLNHFPGRPGTLSSDEEHQYISSKTERLWQWDRDEPKGHHPMRREGHKPDLKSAAEKEADKDPRVLVHEQHMEIGFEDTPLSQTFEGLEQKFVNGIMKITKEQHDSEDEEIARHRERIREINAQYQERLATVRACQDNRRDEFLRRESQIRRHQYQQAGMSHYLSNAGPSEPHSYDGAVLDEGNQSSAAADFDSYRERAQYLGSARNRGFESRGPYPGGRVYDSGSRYY